MDEHVLRGIARWPDVPAVFDWLSLDRRGSWRLRGAPLSNPTLVAYINRNYAADETGRWFFQNGPQRVYVTLEYAPFVYRVEGAPPRLSFFAHTGESAVDLRRAWLDEGGSLLLETELGPGLVHDHDLGGVLGAFVDRTGRALEDGELECAVQAMQAGQGAAVWLAAGDHVIAVQPIAAAHVPGVLHFEQTPQPDG